MSFENLVIGLSEGNPGAVTFIAEAIKTNAKCAAVAFIRAKEYGITGDKLYMFWNDCCERDTRATIWMLVGHDMEDNLKHLNYENGRGIPFTEEDYKKDLDDILKGETNDQKTDSN